MKPAFATTINKAQGISLIKGMISSNFFILSGQTMKTVGIWLRSQVFAHGQLYVACSRVGKPSALKFAVLLKKTGTIEEAINVVYKEVLNP